MKVDTSKLKKSSSELTPECRLLIDQLTKCRTKGDLSRFLETINVWVYGKCELYHWTHILDRFDKILEEGARQVDDNEFMLYCDLKFSQEDARLLLLVLNFTTLLIEHSFSRHLYNSVEHLTQLLSSQNMDIVLAVLNLLYMFSKRSNFIPRLSLEKKDMLLTKLYNIAERWGDPNYGLALIDCCIRKPKLEFLYQLSIEYSDENGQVVLLEIPDMVDTCRGLPISEVVKAICGHMKNPSEAVKMRIAHRIRLVSGFKNQRLRLQFVQARLQAISVLIYSNALQDNVERILYSGFGEELCELIDKEDVYLVEIRAAVLRTLTSMLHFDRNPNVPRPGSRLSKIIQYTGAERQGGILPLLVRDCITSLTHEGICEKYPLVLATSLFSLLYHLASYEAGGHALVKSGMMKSLLQVINWPGVDLEHITFVTRAVRVIDLITNIDITKFHQSNGLNIFIDRMEKEIDCCRNSLDNAEMKREPRSNSDQMENDVVSDQGNEENALPEPFEESAACLRKSEVRGSKNSGRISHEKFDQDGKKMACVTQRAALLKSMLNFLKKSIQDHAHFNGMRNIMESSLPKSLQHIIANAEYYGPSLFLLATDVVTVYVFNEPSLLSSLQETGLTNVILRSLLQKEVPATREILGSLPNIFSALCLNERGLMEFMTYDPFDKFLRVLLSPDYLVAMRRRRSSDPLGDTSTNLGNAMDDLMKHHPYLRTDAIEAIVRLLNELVRFGSDSNYICWRAHKDNNNSVTNTINSSNNHISNTESSVELRCNENDSSGEDDEDDDEMSSASQQQQRQNRSEQQVLVRSNQEREAIPLIDYILNVMKFIDAIFSNSSNGDHCREFVIHGGLQPLLQLLSLPNLPIDSPVSTTAQAVANVCKSILNLAHDTSVIDFALAELTKIMDNLKPLISNFNFPGGSILLHELIACPKLDDGFSTADYTPLLHSMSSVHGYVVLLVHLCRNASSDMRLTLLSRWGTSSINGLQLLQSLVRLYISLVWESTILLSLCSDEISETGLYDAKLTEQNVNAEKDESTMKVEKLSSVKTKIKADDQLRYIKSLLAASSRLGRALAELFGTLVKLSVGTPQTRQRRSNDYSANATNKIPTADAKEIAKVLSSILVNGFCHEDTASKPAPKLKLTFLICSVGFTGPMLFDDKRSCFHLMISQFCEENGLKAFFDMFYWALSLDNSSNTFEFEHCLELGNILKDTPSDTNEYPVGTGEFIDAWLQLLEKMINPRGILDSPYILSSKGCNSAEAIDFEAIFYLIQMHQLAMHVIRRIWKRKPIANYGVSITETIMAILKHIIKSYNMISNRYKARLEEIQNAEKLVEQRKKASQGTDEGYLNANHLKVLTDMGFGKQHVLDALRSTRSLEQATEFLLNHPEATTTEAQTIESFSTPQPQPATHDMDIDIDTASTSASSADKRIQLAGASKSKQCGTFQNVQLLPNDIFDQFCNEVFERVFAFMEYLPETVNTGTELLSALYRQNNTQSKRIFMMNLVKSVTECMDQIINIIKSEKITNTSQLENIFFGDISIKLLIRLKVSTILLDENYSDIRKEFCMIVSQEKSISVVVSLLYETEALLKEQTLIGVKPQAPQWLQNFIEFIDAIDNVCVILQRRENMRAVCSDKWRWYDVSTGKWNSYTESNNNLIKNAFAMGEKSQVINIGRQRYTVNFNCMTQVSEASGSHRPVLPDLKISEAICSLKNGNANSKTESILTRSIRSKPCGDGVIYKDELICLRSLASLSGGKKDNEMEKNIELSNETDSQQTSDEAISIGQKKSKIKNTNKLASKKTSTFSKHSKKVVLHEELVGLSRENCTDIIACLVHLLRPEFMVDFETKLSIMKICARLTKDYDNAKAFYENGGIPLLLKMRQNCGMMGFPTYAIVIIRHILEAPSILQESIERILTTRSSPTVPVGHRDLVYLLTQVSSAVARHPSIFLKAAKQSFQADNAVSSNFPFDESRFLVKSQVTSKTSETFGSSGIKSDDASEETVKELLKAIVQPCVHYGGVSSTDANNETMAWTNDSITAQADKSQMKSSSTKKFTENVEINPSCCSWHIPSTSHTHHKPILPRSTLLKIIADAVRSYQCFVPKIIMEHKYTPADSPLINKPQSCISFILDHFLPITKRQQDPEVSMMSRVLLSSLSDCVSQPTVQSKLVEELHEAIVRILTEPNYTEKHVRLQVLIGLIPVMIESPMLSNKVHLQRNNMYRILLRQDIMTDLAKLAQYKDLSNSNTLATIHSTLRPMEILLRLTITPGTLSSRRIFFGTPPNGTGSVVSRRLYPRLTSRNSTEGSGSSSVGSEHVLRDIIRNVLSDRRQAFDFILNGEDIFLDSEDQNNSTTAGHDDTEENDRESHILTSTNLRPQINFDQLWDDLLQNGNVAFLGRSSDSNNGPADGSRIDGRNSRSDSNQAGNAENVVSGGSDGASTTSELVAAAVDNVASLLGEVSTSEDDSDSNASLENDRNDEDEDDEDDEDGNEEDVEDHSETDADEETRQFIEVFDHIYEPESSETASNDGDDEASEVSGRSVEQVVNGSDADDETSEVSGRSAEQAGNAGGNHSAENRVINSTGEELAVQNPNNILLISEPISRESMQQSASNVPNNLSSPSFPENNVTNREETSVRTNPSSVWIEPRIGSARGDSNYAVNADSGITSANNQDRGQNSTTVYGGSAINQATSIGSFIQRRESTRRLILLDQQYCTLMPSFNNPTEEGQLDIFNQDSLHWWLEEAKHLDLESQTDACLYVAHLLIPFLIRAFRESSKLKTVEPTVSTNNYNSPNRRSAIPVFIQQTTSSNNGTVNTSLGTENAMQRNEENNSLPVDIQDQQDQISSDDVGEVDYSSEEENPTILLTNEEESIQNVEEDFEDGQDESSSNLNSTAVREEVTSAFDIQIGNEIQTGIEQPSSEDMDNLVSQASELFSANESVDISSDNIVLDNIEDSTVSNQEQVVPSVEEQQSHSASTATSDTTSSSTMNAEVRAALGDLQVPEGVDPSFLAALPAEMREEVINEHLRMQRIRQRAQQNAIQVAHDSLIEVNPEFLAALPPNIQTEVLMQQRIEQQRQAASAANPDDPVDTAAFFQNLPESLRQAILTDMEESQIASLPPDLAAEAQYLRRDWESRNSSNVDTPHLLRRFPSSLQNLTDDSRWHSNSIWYEAHGTQQSQHHQHTTIVHQHQQQAHGKPVALLFMEDDNNMLDPDCLATMLLFLFTEDTKINYTRFHRVMRNLCYHAPTRMWIINALISIIQKTNEESPRDSDESVVKPNWLKLKVDAAFGYKSNVFIINKMDNRNNDSNVTNSFSISINPQAAQMVVKNCLDLLFVLARHFPRSFVPFQTDQKKKSEPANETNENTKNSSLSIGLSNGNGIEVDREVPIMDVQRSSSSGAISAQKSSELKLDESPSTSKAAANRVQKNTTCNKAKHSKKIMYNTNGKQFWDVLLKIDLLTPQRLMNMHDFPLVSYPRWEWEEPNSDFQSFNDTPFSKLLEMLPYKVICRSPQLTDMLVKLLASLSAELPKESDMEESKSNNKSLDEDDSQYTNINNAEIKQNEEAANTEAKPYCVGIRLKSKLYSKNFAQLQLVTEVLTHQCGTVEGLENISKLIVNLSQCSHASNAIFLEYLSSAVFGLAKEVRLAIQNLLEEIRSYKVHSKGESYAKLSTATQNNSVLEGVMQDRFTSENVIISAPSNFKPSCELQLPSIKKLLSPSSAQLYFLKTLKIFIQVREIFYSEDTMIMDSTNKKPTLSQIIFLQDLWNTLSECLAALEESKDEYAVLVLQPTVEAFFLIHATNKKNESKTESNIESQSTLDAREETSVNVSETGASNNENLDEAGIQQRSVSLLEIVENVRNSNTPTNPLEVQQRLDKENFLNFAEKHRTVLNQILRQSSIHLSDGPFAVLVDHTRILDFDVKRKYFQTELERIDEGVRREENTVSVRRVTVFEDSFRVLYRLGPEEWKNRFYIVFEDEEGQDAGGLLREWYVIISREIFNPMYALFCVSPGDRVTYMINPSSHANPNHLSYFKFVGRVIAKAIHDNKLLECYFTRSFYKHILGKQVKYTDMESQDYEFYKGLDYLMKNDISTLGYELTFSTEIQEFGVTQVRDLIPNGRNIAVTEENKFDYVQLVCQLKMSGSIRQQLDAFLEGFYDIIPKHLISIFNEQELELLISGLPDIDIEDLRANTEYHKYTSKSLQIQWFWRALRSFDQADRAKFLQFVTGTSKVPLQGFGSLEGMNGIQRFQIHRDDRSTDRLPCAHTCFNQLDLPMYKSYEKLRGSMLKAIHECSEGFGFA